MGNLQSALREAMAKASRRQIRLMVGNQGHMIADLRRKMKALRGRVDQAERLLRSLQATASSMPAPEVQPPEGKKRRMTGKGIRSLRRRLGLTQDQMAKLSGVTPQAVYLWERKGGPIRLRETTRSALDRLQAMGRREATAMLEAAEAKRAAKASRPAGRKAARKPATKPAAKPAMKSGRHTRLPRRPKAKSRRQSIRA